MVRIISFMLLFLAFTTNAQNLGGGRNADFGQMNYAWTPSTSFILDQIGTPSAVAYSLRKLSSTYTGSAIRVRRSSDNTESDIGFNSSGNLDQSALTSFVGSGSGFITTWYDQSGNGRNAIQSTAAAQPRIVNAGVLETMNGRPAMNMLGAQWMSMASSFSVLRNDITVAAPMLTTDNTAYANWFVSPCILGAEMGGVVNDFGFGYNNGRLMIGDEAPQYNGTRTLAGAVNILTYTRQSSNGALYGYLNSTLDIVATGRPGTRVNTNLSFGSPNAAGGSNCLRGSYSELIIFSLVLSDANRILLQQNQAVFFGAAGIGYNGTARYLGLVRPGTDGGFILADLQAVSSGINVAAGKPITGGAADGWYINATFPLIRAADGDVNTFTATNGAATNVWVQVDLGASLPITTATLVPRQTSYNGCLNNAYIVLSNNPVAGQTLAQLQARNDVRIMQVVGVPPTAGAILNP